MTEFHAQFLEIKSFLLPTQALLILCRAAFLFFGRTHATDSINFPRPIHKLDSANSVTSCAVFFLKPR